MTLNMPHHTIVHPELNSDDPEEPANTEESSEERRRLIKQGMSYKKHHSQNALISDLFKYNQSPVIHDCINNMHIDIRRRLESTHMEEDGLSALLTQLQPYLQDMFNKADLGGVDGQSASDGLVTFDEIVSNVDGVDGSDADQALFNAVDADGDGQVTYQEFATFVQFYLMTQMHTAGGGNVTPAQIAESVRQLILSGR